MACGGLRTGGSTLVDIAVPALLVTGNQMYRRRSSRLYKGNGNKSYHKRSNKTYRKRKNKTYKRR